MTKNIRRLAAGVLALALVGAACGGDDGGDGAATTAGPDTTAGSGTGTVELRWRTRPDNQAEIDVYQKVSDTIAAKNLGFTLKYEPGGSETSSYQDQLKTEIQAGTAPDVFWIPGTDIADFATRGLIMDLGPMKGDFDTSAFYPEPMAQLTTDPATGKPNSAKLWGLPRDVSTFALYLNNDLISQAGADDPRELAKEGKWTWEAFADVAKKVTALGGANKGFAMNAWWANYGYFMNNAGGGFFNADRTACAADSDASIAGLEFISSVYRDGSAVPYGDDGEKPWVAGTVGMFVNGRWATPGARANAKFDWDVVTMPAGPNGPGGNWLFWGAYVVNANTKHPDQAWRLVQELTDPAIQSQISELGANIPSRKSQESIDKFLTFTPPANAQAFIDGISTKPVAEGPLWAGSWPDFNKVLDTEAANVLTGKRPIEDFKAKICSETAAAFAKS